MADFHAADLWVAVVPDVSKVGPAMQKAGEEGGKSFKEGIKDIGKGIHEDLDKVSAKAKDALGKAGKTGGEAFSSELGKEIQGTLRETVPAEIQETFSKAGTAAGQIFHSQLKDQLKSGDLAGAFEGAKTTLASVEDLAKNIGIDISGWHQPVENAAGEVKDFGDKAHDAATKALDIANSFTGLPGKIGESITKMTLLAGEVGAVVTIGKELYDQFAQPLDVKINMSGDLGSFLEHHTPGDLARSLADSLGAGASRKFFGDLFGYDPEMGHGPPAAPAAPGGPPSGGREQIPYPEHFIGPIPPGGTRAPGGQAPPVPGAVTAPGTGGSNFYRDWYGPAAPEPAAPRAPREPAVPRARTSASPPPARITAPRVAAPSSRDGVAAAGSNIANLYALADALEGTPYSTDLRNDCSGMVHELAAVAVGLPPPPGSERFSTVTEQSWLLSHGFRMGRGGPGDLRIGWTPLPGMAGHTAATLPGGEHAEQGGSHPGFLVGAGAAGAEDPQFSMHAYLPMGGPGARPGAPGTQYPVGTQHDPVYVTQTGGDTGAGAAGGSPASQQGQELGQGLVSGILQVFGLDSSVFGGKPPTEWGAVKLGTGLANVLGGWAKAGRFGKLGGGGDEDRAAAAGLGGGGDGGGLGGLTGLIPHPGQAVSKAAQPTFGGPGGQAQQNVGGGDIHNDFSINVTGNNVQDDKAILAKQNEIQNSRYNTYAGNGPMVSV